VVGFTTGSRGEVPGKKENLLHEKIIIIINSRRTTSTAISRDELILTASEYHTVQR
jgi:hypothetical protein